MQRKDKQPEASSNPLRKLPEEEWEAKKELIEIIKNKDPRKRHIP